MSPLELVHLLVWVPDRYELANCHSVCQSLLLTGSLRSGELN